MGNPLRNNPDNGLCSNPYTSLIISNTTTSVLDSPHFEHNNERVRWTVGTSSDSRPRRHRVPVALTQTLGLSQARPPAGPCDDFSHFFDTMNKPSHKEAAVRCSTPSDHNDECAGLSARILITTMSFDGAHRCFSCAREKHRP